MRASGQLYQPIPTCERDERQYADRGVQVFVIGVILGPAVGLAIGYLLSGSTVWRGWARGAALLVFLLVLAIVPIGDVGLRLGLAAGIGIGVLLYATPVPATAGNSVLFQPGATEESNGEAIGL